MKEEEKVRERGKELIFTMVICFLVKFKSVFLYQKDEKIRNT